MYVFTSSLFFSPLLSSVLNSHQYQHTISTWIKTAVCPVRHYNNYCCSVCVPLCLPGCLIITYQFCACIPCISYHCVCSSMHVHVCPSHCLLHCVCVCVCASCIVFLCNWRLLNVERRNEKSWKKKKHFERFRNFLTEKWLKHLRIPTRKPSRPKGKWFKYSDFYYI